MSAQIFVKFTEMFYFVYKIYNLIFWYANFEANFCIVAKQTCMMDEITCLTCIFIQQICFKVKKMYFFLLQENNSEFIFTAYHRFVRIVSKSLNSTNNKYTIKSN